jgi:sugar phosphate isomerase/epimerase
LAGLALGWRSPGFNRAFRFEASAARWRRALDLVKKLSGRVSQIHLKDPKAGLTLPNFGGLPNDAFRELGDGIILMELIMVAAETAGVKHCYAEQDQSPDPLASIRQSMEYLKKL